MSWFLFSFIAPFKPRCSRRVHNITHGKWTALTHMHEWTYRCRVSSEGQISEGIQCKYRNLHQCWGWKWQGLKTDKVCEARHWTRQGLVYNVDGGLLTPSLSVRQGCQIFNLFSVCALYLALSVFIVVPGEYSELSAHTHTKKQKLPVVTKQFKVHCFAWVSNLLFI